MPIGWEVLGLTLVAFLVGSLAGASMSRPLRFVIGRFGAVNTALLLLMLAGPGSVVAVAAWIDTVDVPELGLNDVNEPMAAIPEPRPVEASAYSDLGRPVPLFTRLASDLSAEKIQRREIQEMNRSELALIRTDEPDASYNCHGWVFTGGRYWVRSESVDSILHDNGYYEVSGPQVGDLVVYPRRRSCDHSHGPSANRGR